MVRTAARATLFHGLADPARVALLDALAAGPQRVTDLVPAVGMAQPSVSKHLACLWDCGLVERERQGREMHYRLASELTVLLEAADAVLERSGERIESCPRYGHRAGAAKKAA